MTDTPFYLDWQFWNTIVAFTALGFASVPKIYIFFRKGRVAIEKYRSASLSHGFGCPNVSLHLILKNIGGQDINVHKINMLIERKNSKQFCLSGQGYFVNPTDERTALLTPFSLSSGESWSHVVHFCELWDHERMKQGKMLASQVRDSIITKQNGSDSSQGKLIEADKDIVDKLEQFAHENFEWKEGKYTGKIVAYDRYGKEICTDSFSFTIFDSDSAELLKWVEDYKYGFGVYLNNSVRQKSAWVDLS